MEVTFQCTSDDYAETQRVIYRGTSVVYIPVALGVLFFALGVWEIFVNLIARAVPPLALGVLWFSVPLIFFRSGRAKREFLKHPHLSKEYRLRADDGGIWMSSDISEDSNKWAAYTKFCETTNLFMLYKGPRLFEIIPKRAFRPVEPSDFRALLNKNIPSK